jgi:thioesterase domain-containing protein
VSGERADLEALIARLANLPAEERTRLEREFGALGPPAGLERPARGELLVTLRAEGGGVPLFFAAPSFGSLLHLRAVAEALAPGFPVHALVPPEEEVRLDRGELRAYLVDLGVRAVRGMWRGGPYLLGGFCLGGLYAVEIARALHEAGERVPGCLLLDAPFPRSPAGRRLARVAEIVEHHLRGAVSAGATGVVRYLSTRLRRVPRFLRLTSKQRDWIRQTSAVDLSFRLSVRAFRHASLAPCPVPLYCLSAAGGLVRGGERRRRRAWQEIATAGLRWTLVPGEHDALFAPPNLTGVVRGLSEAYGAALRSGTPG